jgi:hypothetical protein
MRAQLAMVHPVGSASEHFDAIVPRLGEAAAPVRDAVRAGRALGMELFVEALPACLLDDVADARSEARIPETTVVEANGVAFGFSRWRRDEGKRKGPSCAHCVHDRSCEGPWREYAAKYGLGDLVPIP